MSWLTGLGFVQPWLLAGLVVLPALWWLLRLLPPAPRQVYFAPLRLLRGLVVKTITAARMPWWLLLLRLVMVTCLIVALAEPVINPQTSDDRRGPVVIVLEDGWASAADWAQRQQLARQWIDRAERDNRPVLLTGTTAASLDTGLLVADQARQRLAAWQPKPFLPDREKLLEKLAEQPANNFDGASILWLDDGLAAPGSAGLMDFLQNIGPVSVRGAVADNLILRPPHLAKDGIEIMVDRPAGLSPGPQQQIRVRALARDGRLLGEQAVDFAAGAAQAKTVLPLPPAWRNQVGRLMIADHAGAAGVYLMDERHQRRPVTLTGTLAANQSQPLLSPVFYLEQALAPFHDLTIESLDDTLKKIAKKDGNQPAMIVLGDSASLTPRQQGELATWMEGGGVLVRFAGSSLASGDDPLIPTRLRQQDRLLGGALTWEKPLPLAAFPEASPFTGLSVPEDVTVTRQILAEPSIDLPGKTWASLRDGTPLVTADRRGRGHLVLFHVTATPEWSSLPLSGVFVDMLRRLSALSEQESAAAKTGDSDTILQPVEILNGFGQLVPPDASVKPFALKQLSGWQPGPDHPPGLYTRPPLRQALNLGDALKQMTPLDVPLDVQVLGGQQAAERPLKAGLLVLALVLLLVDGVISLGLRGLGPGIRKLAMIVVLLGPGWAQAADFDLNRAMTATDRPFLGFIVTGDAVVDRISRAGLDGLAQIMRQRTAADIPGGLPVDPEQDELSFFPLIYWPMTATQPALSDAAVARINAYLGRGGMIIFDTRDQGQGGNDRVGPGVARLRELARGIDIPPLQPVNAKHVLSKSFYLLSDFPGRLTGGSLWVEAGDERRHDGVAGVVISSHDLAAAWAVDEGGQPLVPLGLGGEKQREMAYRTGVNLVMYVLTGNYKADQVHVPFILERLGQ